MLVPMEEPNRAHDILEQTLWLNNHITINNKYKHWLSWGKAGKTLSLNNHITINKKYNIGYHGEKQIKLYGLIIISL